MSKKKKKIQAQQVKNMPPMREAQGMPVWSLGSEDFLEEEMAIYSSILGLKNPLDRRAW